MSDDFDAEDIAVRQQDEIAVYLNESGDVVVCQRSWPDDDAVVLVAPENARRLCAAIMRCAGEMLGAEEADDAGPELKRPMTAAERKRKQRARLCHESRDERDIAVTARDTERVTPLFDRRPEQEDEKARAS